MLRVRGSLKKKLVPSSGLLDTAIEPPTRSIFARTTSMPTPRPETEHLVDEAIALANSTKFGLSAGIFTQNVDWAMRYGSPSIPDRLQALKNSGCERILLAPLYPQYCSATTATVVDKANEWMAAQRWQPSLRTLPPYHDDPLYIDALAADISRQLDALAFTPELLLLSFHGMPARTLELGDPYHCHCHKTARLLEERMAREGLRFRTSFQSRFGRAKWLEPATDAVLAEEAQAGTRRLAVVAPGFSADCLETLEELAIQGHEQFAEAGGEQFAALTCLNTSAAGLTMLEALLRRECGGWI